MKLMGVISVFCGVAMLAAVYGQPARTSASDNERTQWVEGCMKDLESITNGMTRAEVEKKLTMDGGLQGVSPVRFTHPGCQYFKINVEFDFKRDAADQNRAITGKGDKVTRVSKPYLERPFMD